MSSSVFTGRASWTEFGSALDGQRSPDGDGRGLQLSGRRLSTHGLPPARRAPKALTTYIGA
eukprot:scaffold126661_cov28-Tisochrysis_lutea.AAC.14